MTLQLLHSEFPYIWGKFYFIFYQCTGNLLPTVFLRFFWLRRYIPTVHYVLPVLDRYLLLYFLEFGIWNLDHLVTCGIPYANTYGIPRNSAEFRQILLQKIPRNSAEFRGIPYVFQKIPYSVGSQKRTSVDTLVARWTDLLPYIINSRNGQGNFF